MKINEGKQLKIGAILSYFSIALNLVAGLLYTPWMVAQIGKADYGLYTLANSLISLFLVDFGLSTATSRYVSKYRAENNQEKVNNFLGVIYKLYLIIDAVIFAAFIVVFFFLGSIYKNLTPDEIERFKIVFLLSASSAVVHFPFVTFNGILTSYEKFIQLKLADVIYRVLLVGLTVAALLAGYGLYALVAVHSIAGLAIIVYKYIVIKSTTPIRVNFHYSDKALYKSIFSFSFWATIAALAQRLIFNITPTILGVVTNSDSIAVLGVITTIEGYVFTISTAINGMFLPRISKISIGEDKEKNVSELLLKVGKFQYIINGAIVAVFAVVGKRFIQLWMGSDYTDAYTGIMLVIIPGLFYNALQIAHTTLIVEKKVKIQAYVNLGMGLVNVILSFWLSWRVGVLGACISIFIAYTLRLVLLLVIYQKNLRLNIKLFIRECYCRMSIPVIISIVFGLFINQWVADGGWVNFVCKGFAVGLVYILSACFIGLSKMDRKQILGMLARPKSN